MQQGELQQQAVVDYLEAEALLQVNQVYSEEVLKEALVDRQQDYLVQEDKPNQEEAAAYSATKILKVHSFFKIINIM